MGSKTRPTRVLVVDDHTMVRDMIRIGCADKPALEVIAEASSGLEALEFCRLDDPDDRVDLHLALRARC